MHYILFVITLYCVVFGFVFFEYLGSALYQIYFIDTF